MYQEGVHLRMQFNDVEGHMRCWRVYGSFFDLPEDLHNSALGLRDMLEDQPQRGDRTDVTIGAVPPDVRDAEAEWRGTVNLVSVSPTPSRTDDVRIASDAEIEAAVNAERDKAWRHASNYALKVTMVLSRPVLLRVRPDRQYAWGDIAQMDILTEEFAGEATAHLNWIFGTLLAHCGQELFGGAILDLDRVVFTSPSRAAFSPPQLRLTVGPTAVAPVPLLELDESRLHDALALTRITRPQPIRKALERSLQWLTTAVSEQDSLRRFLFAFFGLEVLVRGSTASLRPRLGEQLNSATEAAIGAVLPLDELLWPREPSDRYPDRNLVFAFALMAAVVSPSSSVMDTGRFAKLNRYRNSLAHGSSSAQRPPADGACSLLKTYIQKVMFVDDWGISDSAVSTL